MKSVSVFLLIAIFSLATVAVTAKTVTNPPRNADEQSAVGVAGPAPKPVAAHDQWSGAKKKHKKSKTALALHSPG